MPHIIVDIEYDRPTDHFWLNPDNVATALHAYCKHTQFRVTWAQGGIPEEWADPAHAADIMVMHQRSLQGGGQIRNP